MVKAPDQNGQNSTELDTFLPQDGSNINGSKYKVSVVSKDVEAGETEFDPFKHRVVENPTSDCDTLTHLLKASLGTGILAMPIAFKYSGLLVGIFSTILVALVCTHCAYILVVCAHELYRRTRVTAMSFADVVAVSFANGPSWCKKFAGVARVGVLINLFVTYYGTCSVYAVLIAENFLQVANQHLDSENQLKLRVMIACLLIPLIILSWVPDLKYLAPVSMIANAFMAVGLGITFYYLVADLPSIEDRELAAPITTLPAFFSIVIFAMEAIGVVMPLENNMKTPQHFTGLCGVLNKGMSGVTLVYIFLGFLGYLKYGEHTAASITLNLPKDEWPAQAVKILIGLAVFCTFGLQFFVCLEIAWNGVKDYCKKKARICNYLLRTVLAIVAVLIAIAVPTIGPFMGLIGAFCFSILGILFPVAIETITFWDQGFGKYHWKIWKNVVVVIIGLLALVFGTESAIREIAALYT